MGRGDRKSKKGKIWAGSFGVNRNKKAIKAKLKRVASKKTSPAAGEAKPKAAAKRAPRKKESAAE